MKPTILAIDNDPVVLNAVKVMFEDAGIGVRTASSPTEGLAVFRANPELFPVVLLDYDMRTLDGQGSTGDKVARELKSIHESVRIAIMSGHADSEPVVQACLDAGAEKFICKSEAAPKVLATVSSMVFDSEDSSSEESETDRRQKIAKVLKMVGNSREFAKVADLISRFSDFDEPVLILGESGVGKEGVARAVHENSHRRDRPFIAINCAAIGRDLLESELFGHEQGAFTGALRRKVGLFEQANGGTIFLDEIGDMPLELQVKLLRALQEKVIQPVGGMAKKIDFRVIAATHCNLKSAAEEKRFRQDLYYRLKYLTVDVPPLRDRPEDIEPLARHFIAQMEAKTGKKRPLSDSALRKLKSYPWPGNVRDLEAVVTKAFAMAEDRITPQTLQGELTDMALANVDQLLEKGEIISYKDFLQIKDEQERRLLLRAMELSGNVKSAAAALLGINHNTMNYRRVQLGIDKNKPLAKPVLKVEA